jgi:hypothetical protein
VVVWYILPVLLCLDQEKSGNPVRGTAAWFATGRLNLNCHFLSFEIFAKILSDNGKTFGAKYVFQFFWTLEQN